MKNKVKKYHRGGSHEDHHAAKVASPTPTPRPKSSELKSARDRLRRLPSSKRRPPRATQTTGQIASRPPSTQPLMQPTQTGQMSPMQRNMMEYALERAKQQAKAQEELRKENEAYRKRVMQGGDKRIKKGSKLDESIRNIRSQQLASYANSRPPNTQDLEKDKVERIKLQNEAERIGGTGRRVNLNAGSRRVRRR